MMSVSAFFDESGKFKDNSVISFCGVAAGTGRFEAFGKEWSACLQEIGIREISAKRAFNARRPFSNTTAAFGIDNRIQAILPFVRCIRNHLNLITGVAVDVQAFKQLPSQFHKIFGTDPFYMAFSRAVLRAVEVTAAGQKLSFICDDEEKTAWHMYKFYRRIKNINTSARKKLAAISLADDRVLFGVQAADLIASLMRLEAQTQFFGTPYYRPLFDAITDLPKKGEQIQLAEMAFCDAQTLSRTAVQIGKSRTKANSKYAK